MYVLQCHAGFSLPVKSGMFSVLGLAATAEDSTLASQIVIVDDVTIDKGQNLGNIIATLTGNEKTVISNCKGVAGADGVIGEVFPEPLKTRYGISLYVNNVVAGSTRVYVR